jgi:hypothetical protein
MTDRRAVLTKAWRIMPTVALLLALAAPAHAAEAVFPAGSRVGLVPPAGMVVSEKFTGFADPKEDAAILIAVLPAAAFSQIEKSLDIAKLKREGLNLSKREPIRLAGGSGFLFTGQQVIDKANYRKWLLVAEANDVTTIVTVQVPARDKTYPDATVRAALATLAVRAKVPEAEQLGLLPFSVGDRAGFQIGGIMRGRALVLEDPRDQHPADRAGAGIAEGSPVAHMLIAAVPGGPNDFDDHDAFARLTFNAIGGLRQVHLTMAEPLRIRGQSGYQTMAEAKDARSGADVMVVQWLRFGGGGFLEMTGIAPAKAWTSVLARMRAVRDSIDLK